MRIFVSPESIRPVVKHNNIIIVKIFSNRVAQEKRNKFVSQYKCVENRFSEYCIVILVFNDIIMSS